MQRYFIETGAVAGEQAVIGGDDYHHIVHVMRMKPGAQVQVVVGAVSYLSEIVTLADGVVTVALLKALESGSEAGVALTLVQGLPKGEKIDLVIRQAAEIGVARVIVFQAERSVAKVMPDKVVARLARWRKIAKEAAELAQRTVVPVVESVPSFVEALARLEADAVLLVPYEAQDRPLPSLKSVLRAAGDTSVPKRVAFAIGPEGGFADAEIALAAQRGGHLLTLGRRILRTETAGLVVATALLYEWDLLGGE